MKLSYPLLTDKPDDTKPQPFSSKEEMARRRAEGLCYFCDEKHTPGHYLKHKKTQLFSMEIDDGETKEESEEVVMEDVVT